jgi:hypothetical protein
MIPTTRLLFLTVLAVGGIGGFIWLAYRPAKAKRASCQLKAILAKPRKTETELL